MTPAPNNKLPDPALLRQFIAEVMVTALKQRHSTAGLSKLSSSEMDQLVGEAVQAAATSGLVEAAITQETVIVMQQDKRFLEQVRDLAMTL